ncbi:hypothetical protein [Candidatus Enterovibrio escicola]|uniref:hypothetical protein n=1 Tax=Candidatus Enterovibrio escicola TaxID=1927127 RepID=UPI001314B21C|nr:hypothetical protein [Candidatus Enterovibrio escacola]
MLKLDNSINFEKTKLGLFIFNIRLFLNANILLYPYLIVDIHLNFVEFAMMGEILV